MRIDLFSKVMLALILLFSPVLASAEEKEVMEEETLLNMEELTFCVDQGSFFFFQPSEGAIYRYGPQGDFTRAYTLIELGEDLEKK